MKGFLPSAYGIPVGISATFWFLMGLARAITEWWEIRHTPKNSKKIKTPYKPSDIAVIVPAHNEEIVIRLCIKAIKRIVKPKQVYVASDGSSDKTYINAWLEGCNVIGFHPGLGKAKAITTILDRFDLYNRYKFILIVDADTKLDKSFLKNALPLFEDPEVGVTFASARIIWPKHIVPRIEYFFIAYRERLNRILQFFYGYGQTWKYTNAPYVVPGFATLWRSNILKKIELDAPGLLIEDFNTAFQIQKKKICRVAYIPTVVGWDQHPDNLPDYWKQVRRWNIGFFQTIRKNGVWPSFFWFMLMIFNIEVFLHSIFLLAIPFVVLFLIAQQFPGNQFLESYVSIYTQFGPFQNLTLVDILVGVFWFDYGMTIIIAFMTKKPQFLIYGLFFFFMHYVTALILMSSLIPGFFMSSKGKWISPKRLAYM